MTIKQAKPKHHCQREGLSLVELMIAMTLLALISVAGHRHCQPWQSYGDNRLATFGGYGQGLWFVARDGLYSCVGPTINSICGHYVEWGGHANDPDITIAQRTTIDVGNHREYCQLE